MKPVLSCDEVRALEDIIDAAGTSKAELMELAGEFAAEQVLKLKPKRVLVLVGFGNNGGDGWVAADILSQKGLDVDVVSPLEPDEISSSLARHVARRTAGRDVNVVVGPSRTELADLIARADVVLDAILGTGFHGALRPPFSIWISTLNDLAPRVISVDVPSGLDAQTGRVEDDCVRATATATMIAPKIGLYSADGPEYAGEIICGRLYDKFDEVIGDVEHAAEIVEPADLTNFLMPLPANIDKYSRGSALIVAGSAAYPGAAIMAAKSAGGCGLRCGCGSIGLRESYSHGASFGSGYRYPFRFPRRLWGGGEQGGLRGRSEVLLRALRSGHHHRCGVSRCRERAHGSRCALDPRCRRPELPLQGCHRGHRPDS